MYWVEDGDRMADQIVRRQVLAAGGHSGTVSHVNSLQGACIAQGIIIARLVREKWPTCTITESHPKALLLSWTDASQFLLDVPTNSEHERDAGLGAYAAMAYERRASGWEDLRLQEDAVCDLVPEPRPVYWFPGDRT
jgi:hypothetical protein